MASIFYKIAEICNSHFKCNYVRNENHFFDFLLHFWNLHQILNILKKQIIFIANVFAKLQSVKNFVRPLCKKRRFRTRFDRQLVNASQMLWKSPWDRLYQFFGAFSGKLIPKISSLVLGEIFGVFVNTLTYRWQVSWSRLWEIATPNSNTIIWKTKTFF